MEDSYFSFTVLTETDFSDLMVELEEYKFIWENHKKPTMVKPIIDKYYFFVVRLNLTTKKIDYGNYLLSRIKKSGLEYPVYKKGEAYSYLIEKENMYCLSLDRISKNTLDLVYRRIKSLGYEISYKTSYEDVHIGFGLRLVIILNKSLRTAHMFLVPLNSEYHTIIHRRLSSLDSLNVYRLNPSFDYDLKKYLLDINTSGFLSIN